MVAQGLHHYDKVQTFFRMNTFSDSVSTSFLLIASFDPLLGSILFRSLAVSACACLLACSTGLVLGAWLGVARFRGRAALLTLGLTKLHINDRSALDQYIGAGVLNYDRQATGIGEGAISDRV